MKPTYEQLQVALRQAMSDNNDYETKARSLGWYAADGKVYRDVADFDAMPHSADNWKEAYELTKHERVSTSTLR